MQMTSTLVHLHVGLHISHLIHHHVGHLVFLHVGHHVQLLVGHHVGHLVGHHNVILTLCEGSETLIEWKSESITDQLTEDGLVGVDLEILDTF